ncbi:MAG: gliding motility-associated ABC transporter permease subunit GldF [Flavobacteriaceae bacterium]|nr:gliding motility-associated ABC transporter permease subunit GldF [Flavobacteriaceae bacterium]
MTMWSIAKRELRFYFSTLIGYMVMGSYLVINTLILWFFDTPYKLINSRFGDLSSFFEINPWLFIFLIPALAMRSFSEERSTGTIEVLLTKPLKAIEIYGGKFLGVTLILVVTVLPTTFNLIALNNLLAVDSELDWGILFSSYLALSFIGFIFLSFSLCSSLLFRNQVTSFLAASLFCFINFFLWGFFAELTSTQWLYNTINSLGIQAHYLSLRRGVINLKDLVYMIGLIFIFSLLGIELIKKGQD